MIPFISTLEDLFENVRTIERYLHSSNVHELSFAKDIVRRGRTILIYRVDGENHFAPSRFLGYKNNNMSSHQANDEKDGRDTNPVITTIVGSKPFCTEAIDQEFIRYVLSLGVEVPNNKRHFWRIRNERGKIWSL